jgi:uncharacterized membrane protein
MRSKAQVKGHPVHPMLVAFPIAFLYGGLFFDLAGRLGGWPSAWTTGAYLSLAALASGRSGAVKAGPAESPIATYPVEQAGDEVRLRLPSA